jgi:hypothetical protein
MYGSTEMTRAGQHGFLYFPHSVYVFTPFAYLPLGVAEVLWRTVSLAAVAWALWEMCSMVGGTRRRLWFGLATLLGALPFELSASNGQANLLVIAAMTLAVTNISKRGWWAATAWLMVATALKPHAMAMTLIVAAVYPQMLWRLVIGLGVLGALPWLRPDWAYVWDEHVMFVKKLRVVTKPPPGANQELVGLLHAFGLILSDAVWTGVRLLGALGTLGACVLAKRRFSNSVALAYMLAITVVFIMLFNPRTEGPTHAMMGMMLGVFAARELIVRPLTAGAVMALGCVLMGVSYELIKPKNSVVLPVLDIAFGGYLLVQVVRGRGVLEGREGMGERVTG